jgi:hypothetical protein
LDVTVNIVGVFVVSEKIGCLFVACSHHAEGLVNPKVLAKKTVTDFGNPLRASTNFFHNVIFTS